MTDGTPNDAPAATTTETRRPGRRGFTIVEVMVVLTMMAVLIAMTAPSFRRAVEKSKADIALTNLRAVWAAERFYWVDNRVYCGDLSQLVALDLLDPEVISTHSSYSYSVNVSADGSTFTATATRASGSSYSGAFSIDQTGATTGSLTSSDDPTIDPAAQ